MEQKTILNANPKQCTNNDAFSFICESQQSRMCSNAFVIRPDGKLRDPDEILSLGRAHGEEPPHTVIWHYIHSDELALTWRILAPGAHHEFYVKKRPDQLTPEQLQTVECLQDEIAATYDPLVDYVERGFWDTSHAVVGPGWNLKQSVELTQAELIELVNHTQARLSTMPDYDGDRPDARVAMDNDGWHLMIRQFYDWQAHSLTQYEVERWVFLALAYEKYAAIITKRQDCEREFLPIYRKAESAVRAVGGIMYHVGVDGVVVRWRDHTEAYGFNRDDLEALTLRLAKEPVTK